MFSRHILFIIFLVLFRRAPEFLLNWSKSLSILFLLTLSEISLPSTPGSRRFRSPREGRSSRLRRRDVLGRYRNSSHLRTKPKKFDVFQEVTTFSKRDSLVSYPPVNLYKKVRNKILSHLHREFSDPKTNLVPSDLATCEYFSKRNQVDKKD